MVWGWLPLLLTPDGVVAIAEGRRHLGVKTRQLHRHSEHACQPAPPLVCLEIGLVRVATRSRRWTWLR